MANSYCYVATYDCGVCNRYKFKRCIFYIVYIGDTAAIHLGLFNDASIYNSDSRLYLILTLLTALLIFAIDIYYQKQL